MPSATLGMVGKEPLKRDAVDALVDFWCQENPALDRMVKMLAIRVRRTAHHLERVLRQELAASGMETWEFEVLLALRRTDGYCRSAGDLLRESQVTSGAITNRVAQLEKRGWVKREVCPSDRRQVLVSLTPEGIARSDQLLATKTQADLAVFGHLDARAQERLNDDLRALLISLEGEAPPAGPDSTADARRPPARLAPSAPPGRPPR